MITLIHHLSSSNPIIDKEDCFFIDSNILCYLHSGKQYPQQEQMSIIEYSNFISKLMTQGNKLFVTSLNLQEVFHVIEKIEYDDYCKKNNYINKKKYRQIATERMNVKNKMTKAWLQIKNQYEIVDDTITFQQIESFVLNLDTHFYEPIDYVTSERGIKDFNYITNDSDFTHDNKFLNKNVNLFTF